MSDSVVTPASVKVIAARKCNNVRAVFGGMVIFSFCFISCCPVWKCVWGGPPCRTKKVSHSASPRINLLQQTMKRGRIVFIPLGRDPFGYVQQSLHSDFGFEFGQPWD